MNRILFAFFCLMGLVGCSSTVVNINPAYKDVARVDGALGVILPAGEVQVTCETVSTLGNEPSHVAFRNLFLTSFPRKMAQKSHFRSCVAAEYPADSLTPVTKWLKANDSIILFEPANLRAFADSIRYVLVLSRCAVTSGAASDAVFYPVGVAGGGTAGAGFSGGMGYSSQSDPGSAISTRFTFGLWDNRTGQLVSWGRVDASGKPQRVINKSAWFSLVDGMADGLLKNAPYKKEEMSAK